MHRAFRRVPFVRLGAALIGAKSCVQCEGFAAEDHVSTVLQALYDGVPDIHEVPLADLQAIDSSGGHEAYGELTIRGVREIRELLKPQRDDVFVDLGSGAGRCVLQAALEWPCRSCIGVELSESRHRAGEVALARAGSAVQERVRLYHDDLLCCPACEEASIVYVASLLFDDAFMTKLGARLAALPKLRTVVTLTRFPAGALPDEFVEDSRNFACSEHPSVLRERVEVTPAAGLEMC